MNTRSRKLSKFIDRFPGRKMYLVLNAIKLKFKIKMANLKTKYEK